MTRLNCDGETTCLSRSFFAISGVAHTTLPLFHSFSRFAAASSPVISTTSWMVSALRRNS